MSDLVAVKVEGRELHKKDQSLGKERLAKKCLTENLKERLNDDDLRPNLGSFLIESPFVKHFINIIIIFI